MTVCLIAAVGKRGQLGLDGVLPWRDPEDLAFFKEKTMGHIVLVGSETYKTLPELPGRLVHVWTRTQDPEAFLRLVALSTPDKDIFVAGGRRTYQTWLPFVRRSIITHINYDGPADTAMPPLWNLGE